MTKSLPEAADFNRTVVLLRRRLRGAKMASMAETGMGQAETSPFLPVSNRGRADIGLASADCQTR